MLQWPWGLMNRNPALNQEMSYAFFEPQWVATGDCDLQIYFQIDLYFLYWYKETKYRYFYECKHSLQRPKLGTAQLETNWHTSLAS